MAQEGAEFLETLKKLKAEKQSEKGGGFGTPRPAIASSPKYVDQVPPVDDKKGKRKDCGKKPSSSRHSSKRARLEGGMSGLSNTDQLFAPDLTFYKGVTFSLSSAKRGAVNVASTEELANAYFEMQSRTLAFAKVLHAEWSKGSSLEVARLAKELASSSDSLKAALDANTVQGEALKRVEAEREELKVQLGVSERRVRKLSTDLKKAEDNFVEAVSAHDKVASEKARLDLELADLKNSVLSVHS